MNWILSYLPKLWTRQKPDGKRGWGALRYLVFGLVFTFAGIWCINRMQHSGASSRAAGMLGDSSRGSNPAAGNVLLKEVADAAQNMRRPNIEKKSPDSLAGSELGLKVDSTASRPPEPSQPADDPAAGFVSGSPNRSHSNVAASEASRALDNNSDSIFTAMARSDQTTGADGRPVLTEDGGDSGGRSPSVNKKNFGRNGFSEPSVGAGTAGQTGSNQLPSIESLVVKDSRVALAAVSPAEATTSSPQKLSDRMLPRGEIIPVYIMQTVETGKFPTLVQFAVAKTIWFNGKPIIPFGTRFMASAGLGVRDRLTFTVDSLRRRDGLEIACSGILLGTDRATGMQAYYIPPPAMVQAAPYIGSFLQSYADIMKIRATPSTIQIGSVGVTTQRPTSDQMQEAVVSSAAQSMTDFMTSQLAELKERYASYLTIPAGSFGYVELTANSDFSALWDDNQRGMVKTVGKPDVISTESLYTKRDEDRAKKMSLSALAAAAIESRIAQPISTPTSTTAPTTGAAATRPIKDPLSN